MNYITLSSSELRALIQGKWLWSKCPNCNGTGYENWNCETGLDVQPGWSDENGRESDDCENCNSVGYIAREQWED